MPIIDGKVIRARYTSLKLNELSSVDMPAQAGAKALIMKRDFSADQRDKLAETGAAMPDGSFPIANVSDLSNAVQAIGRAKNPDAARQHIISRARALGATDQLPDSWNVSNKREETMAKTVEQLEADLAKRDEQITQLTADLAKAKQCAQDAEDMLDGGKDEATETKKALATVTKERDELRADLTKATDEVVTAGGVELRKSAVGEANFIVAKALADERDMAKFEKRAEVEFGHLVGTPAEKALVLKALEAPSVSEEARKAALAIFTAAEKMTAAGFDRMGSGHGVPTTPTSKAANDAFMGKVAEIEKRDGITHSAALSKARRENPEEFAAYNGESVN